MAYKEIVTKAVIAKGKKKYNDHYEITVEDLPSTVLGCWIINHDFKATDSGGVIKIDGSFDANVWYSFDNDTKTTVASKRITYTKEEKLNVPTTDSNNKDIIIRSLKQPTCISAKEQEHVINLDIEYELGIEIVGDTKVKISSVDDVPDSWDELTDVDNEIDNLNPNYINEEITK